MPSLFRTQSLAGRRGQKPVFRDVDFALDAGGLLLVTGANGSGKSSLLRVLAGLLPPLKGQIFWQDTEISGDPHAHRERVNYIGHLDALKPELTVGEMLGYWNALRFASPALESALAAFGLKALESAPVKHLSAGQKRRLALTRLVLAQSPLWLLDEPTTALDAQSQSILFDLIGQHRAQGGIVIIASHHAIDLPDAQIIELPARPE